MKVTTITREYDDEGRITKETRTEVDYTQPAVVDSGQWWQLPRQGWWQNPVISYSTRTAAHTSDARVFPVN